MLLGEILRREVIKPSLDATEKYAAIRELVDLLVEAGDVSIALRDHLVDVISARERSGSTGMEMGVALPHASSDRLDRLVGALGISRAGIPFGCLDGAPAKLIILILLPRNELQIHVRTLAGISSLLSEAPTRDALIEAPDVDAVLRLIQGEEKRSLFDRFRWTRK